MIVHYEKGKLRVTCDVREAEYVLTIPGARVKNARSDYPEFTMPATLAQGYALKAFGKHRVVWTPEAKAHLRELSKWAKEQEKRREGDLTDFERLALPDYLWSYQQTGVAFMLEAGSALCGDEMGTGKTIMGAALLDMSYPVDIGGAPSLVVAPKSTLHWWAQVITERTGLTPVVVSGDMSAAKRRTLLEETKADVVVINHALVPKHSYLAPYGSTPTAGEPGPLNRRWSTVIVDEAHKLKDPNAQITRAMNAIGKKADHRYAFTGTPIADSSDDLWSIMHWVAPDEWPSRGKARDRYFITKERWHGGIEVLGLRPDNEPELRKFLMPRFIRRTKKEVALDVPDALPTQYLPVPLSPQQQKVYDQLVKESMAKLPDGRVIMATEQLYMHKLCDYVACGIPVLDEEGRIKALTGPSTKLDALREIIEELAGEPLVVYSPSRKVVDFMADELEKKSKGRRPLRVARITGTVKADARHAYVNQFQAGELDVIFLTAAGAEGITLTRASTLVYVQQDWSEVINLQVGDRIHRPGQEKEVRRIVLMAPGTIDEGRRRALETKGEVQQGILRDKDRLIRGQIA